MDIGGNLLRNAAHEASSAIDGHAGTIQMRSPSLGFNPDFNATALYAQSDEYKVRVVAATFSSCSVLAALCALYWFLMMKRNFRRDLVLLLICGDAWKAFWFLVFASMSLFRGHDVPSTSPFCQASGYLLQVGVESCDIAVFLMSLHMQLQIFPPRESFLGYDGLYRIRHFAYAGWFIIPNLLVSLAFVNGHSAFVSQGGFCTLPIRPYWYRLALSWIPRYLIWVYIMYVAIRIYRHVGFEFKVFGEEKDISSSLAETNEVTRDMNPTDAREPATRAQSTRSDAAIAEKQAVQDDHVAPEDPVLLPVPPTQSLSVNSSDANRPNGLRRQSLPIWTGPFGAKASEHPETLGGPVKSHSKSNPSSRRQSKQTAPPGVDAEDFVPPPAQFDRYKDSISTMASTKTSGALSTYGQHSPGLNTIKEHKTTNATGLTPQEVAQRAMQKRRKAIQRQLRLLFIYPVTYILLWLIPFINHTLNYTNHFAQHPVFAIGALSVFFQTIMGLVDVIIFCWREKPWKHIPGSDGTILGSFRFWKFAFSKGYGHERRESAAPSRILATTQEAAEKRPHSQSRLSDSVKRWNANLSRKPVGDSTTKYNSSSAPTLAPPEQAAAAASPPPPPATAAPARWSRRLAPPMHLRSPSGGSDRRMAELERVQERLALERAEYARQHQKPPSSAIGADLQDQQQQQKRKEWWDRQGSIMDD